MFYLLKFNKLSIRVTLRGRLIRKIGGAGAGWGNLPPTRLIRKMGGKKSGGQKKRSLFQKQKKWGISKIKGRKMGGRGIKKPQNKKNRPTPCGREKI